MPELTMQHAEATALDRVDMQDHLASRASLTTDAVMPAIQTHLHDTPHGVELHNLAFSLHERLILPYEPATADPLRSQAPGFLRVCLAVSPQKQTEAWKAFFSRLLAQHQLWPSTHRQWRPAVQIPANVEE